MRAYICHARSDMEGHMLQVLDLKPNSSQPGNVLTPGFGAGTSGVQSGQTGYLSYGAQMDAVTLHAGGAGAFHTNADYYGLDVYLIDNVNNVTGNVAISATQALNIARGILLRVGQGLPLTLAAINVVIRAEGADGGFPALGAGSTLNGAGATFSTGSVVEVLRIISGEAYLVPANSIVIAAGGAFPGGVAHVKLGSFIARTTAGLPTVGYRAVRRFYATGALSRSVLNGALSKLAAATYTWINPTFTYGATGNAYTYAGVNIGINGVAKAVTVYAADGSVI